MDCALTLSFSPSTIVRKNASTRLRVRVASKKPARIAETVPPVTVTSSHGKRACVEDGGGRGNSHDARHHNPAQRCFQRRRQETTGGNYANEPFLPVNRVKVNDAFAHAFASDALERFAYRHVRIQQRKILARMFDNRRVKIRDARSDIHLATR